MAYAAVVEIPGGTLKHYEQVAEAMRLKGVEEAPEGMMIHFAGLAGDSLSVVDVWESREAYERHLAEIDDKARESVRKAVGDLPPYTHREFEIHKLVK